MPDKLARGLLLVIGLLASILAPPTRTMAQGVAPGEWKEFSGTWTAVGNRQTIGLGPGRRASVVDYTGSLLLSGPSRPAVGFRAEAVVLADTQTGMVGRAVWTDDNGDQVYSELHAASIAKGSRISGTFVGGTGRYQGAVGEYSFAWRFQIDSDDGTVQGQSEGLTGRVRETPKAPGAAR